VVKVDIMGQNAKKKMKKFVKNVFRKTTEIKIVLKKYVIFVEKEVINHKIVIIKKKVLLKIIKLLKDV